VDRDLQKVLWRLDFLIVKTLTLIQQGEREMAAIDDLTAQVAQTVTIEASAVTLIQGIAKLLADAIASNDPAKLVALQTTLNESATQLADAIKANTPAA
jgi:hypothetical protein